MNEQVKNVEEEREAGTVMKVMNEGGNSDAARGEDDLK